MTDDQDYHPGRHVILIGSPTHSGDLRAAGHAFRLECQECGLGNYSEEEEDEEPEDEQDEFLDPQPSDRTGEMPRSRTMCPASGDGSASQPPERPLRHKRLLFRRRNSWPPLLSSSIDRLAAIEVISAHHNESPYYSNEHESGDHQQGSRLRNDSNATSSVARPQNQDLFVGMGPSDRSAPHAWLRLLQDAFPLTSVLYGNSVRDAPTSGSKTNTSPQLPPLPPNNLALPHHADYSLYREYNRRHFAPSAILSQEDRSDQSSDTNNVNNDSRAAMDLSPSERFSRLSGRSSPVPLNRSLSTSEWELRFNSEVGLLYDELNEMRHILSNMLYSNNIGNLNPLLGELADLGAVGSPLLFPTSPLMSAEEVLANIIAFIPHRDAPPAPPSSRRPSAPEYPIGELQHGECDVCLETKCFPLRSCCAYRACDSCVRLYYESRLELGSVAIQCINSSCSAYVHRNEIFTALPLHLQAQYLALLQAKNVSPTSKTCPRCNHLTTMSEEAVKRMSARRHVVLDQVPVQRGGETTPKMICTECGLVWCFLCHAPWHTLMTCKQFRKGDRLLKKWAKEVNHGQANAQKCPKCKVYIQRTSGCDHMQCTVCKTDFCYKCGERLRRIKFFGDHYSKYSIFGCKYRYKADKPVQRKVIRGAVFGSKVMLVPVLGSVAVCAGFALVTVGVAGLPLYAGLKIYQKIQERKYLKAYRNGTISHLPSGESPSGSGTSSPTPPLDGGAFVESNSFTLSTTYSNNNSGLLRSHYELDGDVVSSLPSGPMASGYRVPLPLPRPVSNFGGGASSSGNIAVVDNIHAIQAAIHAAQNTLPHEY